MCCRRLRRPALDRRRVRASSSGLGLNYSQFASSKKDSRVQTCALTRGYKSVSSQTILRPIISPCPKNLASARVSIRPSPMRAPLVSTAARVHQRTETRSLANVLVVPYLAPTVPLREILLLPQPPLLLKSMRKFKLARESNTSMFRQSVPYAPLPLHFPYILRPSADLSCADRKPFRWWKPVSWRRPEC